MMEALGSSETPFAACFRLASYLASSSSLNIQVICSSETSADFHRTTRCYIPDDRTLINVGINFV
jgi:hypothetical protein